MDAGRPTSAFDESRQTVYRDVVIVAAGLIVVTLLHYYTPTTFREAHVIYRRLYYLPIIYAAFRFGIRGGVTTAIAASILFVPHAEISLGGLSGAYGGVDNGLEVVLFNVVGVATGLLATAARREVERSRSFAGELERAYSHLEQRAVELNRIREYVQAVLDSVVSGVVTIDHTGVVTMVNPAAARILGLVANEMQQGQLCDAFEDDGGLCEQVQPLLTGEGQPAGGEIEVVVKGGRRLSLATHISQLVEADGKVLGAVLTIEDQTELKILTEQLIRADRLAALGELVAGLAHEIRNPLAIIKGSLQVHAQTAPPDDEAQELSKIINQEIDRLDTVIKALLDFGRPSPPQMKAVDVAKVVDETATLTRKYALQHGVDVAASVDEGLPDIMADADQIKQVLVNLISNAVQAIPHGGTVRIEARRDGETVSLTVADDGIGIGRDDLAHVFDPFHTNREGGTGLGLTIVHRIVDEHGGRIGVESRLDEGTTFTVRLPIATATASDPEVS